MLKGLQMSPKPVEGGQILRLESIKISIENEKVQPGQDILKFLGVRSHFYAQKEVISWVGWKIEGQKGGKTAVFVIGGYVVIIFGNETS